MQSNEGAECIKSFPSKEGVQAEDQVLIIQAKDLQALISAAVNPLLVRIDLLERLVDIYISPDPRVVDLGHEYNRQITEAARAKTQAAKEHGLRIADCEERIVDLETSRTRQQLKATAGKVTESRMLKLAITLVNQHNNPMSFSDIGKLLELGSRDSTGKKSTRKQNMTHFGRKLLAAPEKFILKTDKQGHSFVHLTKLYYDHLMTEYGV